MLPVHRRSAAGSPGTLADKREASKRANHRGGSGVLSGIGLLIGALLVIGGGGYVLFAIGGADGGGSSTRVSYEGGLGGNSRGGVDLPAASEHVVRLAEPDGEELSEIQAQLLKNDAVARKIQAAHAAHAAAMARERDSAQAASVVGEGESDGGDRTAAATSSPGDAGDSGSASLDELWIQAAKRREEEIRHEADVADKVSAEYEQQVVARARAHGEGKA